MENADLLFFNHADLKDESTCLDLDSLIASVDSSMRICGQSAFIIDFDQHKILYRTEQLLYIDEATHNDIKRECSNPYWSLVPEQVLSQLLQIRNSFPQMNDELQQEDYSKHICVIDYPIWIRGHELYITQKFTPLIMRSDGITRIGLFTINPSNKRNVECLLIAPKGRRFRYDFSEGHFKEFNLAKTLTVTERTILFRAKMGMTSEEIAESLFLSVHTVKTHRGRIFKKLNVDTISEALTVIGNYQLL